MMRKIPPIPKKLLVHTVEYHEYDPTSPYGEAWKEPITLSFVRVEPNRSSQSQVPYEEIVTVVGANLYYDTTHSLPKGITFVDKSKIVFNGREMYVNSTDALYTFNSTPHHYEVQLA